MRVDNLCISYNLSLFVNRYTFCNIFNQSTHVKDKMIIIVKLSCTLGTFLDQHSFSSIKEVEDVPTPNDHIHHVIHLALKLRYPYLERFVSLTSSLFWSQRLHGGSNLTSKLPKPLTTTLILLAFPDCTFISCLFSVFALPSCDNSAFIASCDEEKQGYNYVFSFPLKISLGFHFSEHCYYET